MIKAGAEIGFSPASRTRVQLEKASRFPWLNNPRNDPDGLLAMPPPDWWNRHDDDDNLLR